MNPNNPIPLPIEEIYKRCLAGEKRATIAVDYNVSITTINKRLNNYCEANNLEVPKRKPPTIIERYNWSPEKLDEIVEEYKKGISMTKLSKKYRVGVPAIRKIVNDYYEKTGEEKPDYKHRKSKSVIVPMDEIIDLYEKGYSQSAIARRYNLTSQFIGSRITEHYKLLGQEKPKIEINSIRLPINEIISRYEAGEKIQIIAKDYNVGDVYLTQQIDEYYKLNNLNNPIQRTTVPQDYTISKVSNTDKKSDMKDLVEKMIMDMQNGKKQSEIAQLYNMKQDEVAKLLHKYWDRILIEKTSQPEFSKFKYKVLKNKKNVIDFFKRGYSISQIKIIAEENYIIIPQVIINSAIVDIIIDYLKDGYNLDEIMNKILIEKQIFASNDVIEQAINIVQKDGIKCQPLHIKPRIIRSNEMEIVAAK